jgi:hypothetical protein
MRTAVFGLGAAILAVVGLARAEPLSLKDAKAARKVYVAKCAKCHRFYDPKKYSDADWSRWIDKMSRKSKLKEDQETLLKSYLDEYRAGRIEKLR